MTIIARRGLLKALTGGLLAAFGVWMMICSLLAHLFPESPDDKYVSIFLLAAGIALIIACIPFYVKHYRVPKYVIWYENGTYHFPDFECKSDFIKSADFKIKYSLDGHLTVVTRDGQEHLYKHIQDVSKAQFMLMLTILHDEGYLNG